MKNLSFKTRLFIMYLLSISLVVIISLVLANFIWYSLTVYILKEHEAEISLPQMDFYLYQSLKKKPEL